MTNEKKAKKIVNSVFSIGLNANNTFYDMAINAALDMARWKDSQQQIIEIFGKRVKIINDDCSSADNCKECALFEPCYSSNYTLCQTADEKFNRHFVEVDEDANEIKQ